MKKSVFVWLFCAGLLLSGCAQKKTVSMSLTIGLMPSMDAVPILWAEHEGYFTDAGLDVSLIIYTNGNDRDTQVQTKAVDAVVSDIMGLVTMRQAGYDVQAVSQTQTAFSLIHKAGVLDRTRFSIALAQVSVTQYAADMALRDKTLEKQFVDALPQRLELVSQDLVDSAVLPEPMASTALLSGLEDTVLAIDSPNCLMFQTTSINEKQEAIRAFYKAYDQAVATLTDHEADVKAVVVEKLGLSEAVGSVMHLPTYTAAQPISEDVYNSVLTWMANTLETSVDVSFKDASSSLLQ